MFILRKISLRLAAWCVALSYGLVLRQGLRVWRCSELRLSLFIRKGRYKVLRCAAKSVPCLLLLSISTGCKKNAPGGVATDGALVIQTLRMRAEFKKDSKVVGECKRGTVAKYLKKDLTEKELWYHIDCDGLNGWFKFTPDSVVVGSLAGLADRKDKILEKYPAPPPSAPIAFNTLTLAASVPADDLLPHKKWKPYAATVPMRHAVVGKWAGNGDDWVLYFTNGSGTNPCAELSQPTGHLLVTLLLPGPIGKEATTAPVEPTGAFIYANQFNVTVPLDSMNAKKITFNASDGTKGSTVTGTIDISGDFYSVVYQISGAFEALRCL